MENFLRIKTSYCFMFKFKSADIVFQIQNAMQKRKCKTKMQKRQSFASIMKVSLKLILFENVDIVFSSLRMLRRF